MQECPKCKNEFLCPHCDHLTSDNYENVVTLRVLRQIVEAMGYRLDFKLERNSTEMIPEAEANE